MKIKENKDKTTLHLINSGGIFFFFFGLFFMLPGLFIILITLKIISVKGDVPPLFFGVPFGAVFFTVGSTISLGRSGIFININRHSVISWWGILIAFKKNHFELNQIKEIIIKKEIRRSKNSTYTVYPVRATPFSDDLKFTENRDYLTSRRTAEKIARFIKRPLIDFSKGEGVKRDWDKLDESIQDRLRRTGESIPLPEKQTNFQALINETFSRMVIEIPPRGINIAELIKVAAPLIPLLFFFSFFSRVSFSFKSASPVFLIIPAIMLLCLLPKLLNALNNIILKKQTIKIADNSLSILNGKKETVIDLNQIEEISVASHFISRSLIFLTDNKIYSAGENLSAEELEYIKAIILNHLSN